MPIRAVFFDLDDTLLETRGAHLDAIQAAHGEMGAAHVALEACQEAFFDCHRAYSLELRDGDVAPPDQHAFFTRVWADVHGRFALPAARSREIASLYLRARRQGYRLFQEVPALLDRLAATHSLVLVTNGFGELQREKIAAVNLERWFDRILVSGEVGSWKPDAAIFRRALELAGAAPPEAVMVGDSLEADVRGARALGIRTLWVRRYAHLAPVDGIVPDAEAADLAEFHRHLDAWA